MSEARRRIISPHSLSKEEEDFNWSLRPRTLDEVIGQRQIVERLRISLLASRSRGEPFPHALFHGPPGLGKTTLANVIANELGTKLHVSSGPSLTRPGDLLGVLTKLERRDVLFIDEIHRLPAAVEEYIYPAMEDFKVTFTLDKGTYASSMQINVKPFTLLGATTRMGLVSKPLRDRFGNFHHVDFYPPEDLALILERSARILGLEISQDAVMQIARRSRGTPRVANRLLRWVRDYASVKASGKADVRTALDALQMEGVDDLGLTDLDRQYLSAMIRYYAGGPVGIDTLAATLNEERDTLEDVVEPFLLKIGFIQRTKQGRQATELAYQHLGEKKPAAPHEGGLFEDG